MAYKCIALLFNSKTLVDLSNFVFVIDFQLDAIDVTEHILS